jgi:hypothetical protein
MNGGEDGRALSMERDRWPDADSRLIDYAMRLAGRRWDSPSASVRA